MFRHRRRWIVHSVITIRKEIFSALYLHIHVITSNNNVKWISSASFFFVLLLLPSPWISVCECMCILYVIVVATSHCSAVSVCVCVCVSHWRHMKSVAHFLCHDMVHGYALGCRQRTTLLFRSHHVSFDIVRYVRWRNEKLREKKICRPPLSSLSLQPLPCV